MSTTILIVGANRGLGLQFALQYLKKGFDVYGTYRKESVDEAKELLESGAKTFTLDLTDEASIQDASKSFGDQPLDILINCAAAGNGSPKWIDTTADEFMRRFQVSVVGPFLTTKAFYPQLKKGSSPLVINISSGAGSISENESGGNLSYRTSKAALNMVTVDLARELAPDSISCISLSPGWVKTKMSNWTGPLEASEAVTRMIKVIDGLKPNDNASFYHRDGHKLGW
ncbi:hypothetical protein QQX98_003147 [Neonectria punicea]|uniref:Short chain dehydrogenase n=1 Tax=Neonectria punicea TaxID=979145 RepID=A0ABR1HF42_9HYPO